MAALLLALCGCCQGELPFRAEDVRSMVVYRFDCTPESAEKKALSGQDEIQDFCRELRRLESRSRGGEPLAGACVVSVRALLQDGTAWEAVYILDSAKRADALWGGLSGQALPAGEDELPVAGPARTHQLLAQ